MPQLTKEELAELAELEAAEASRQADEAGEAKRQHLQALRTSKRLAATHGAPGLDFVVVETRVGNFALRKPNDVEIDLIATKADDSAACEEFCAALAVEPASAEVKATIGKYPNLPNTLIPAIMSMIDMARKDEVKK